MNLEDLPTGSRVVFGGRIWRTKECSIEGSTTLVLDNAEFSESNLDQWASGTPQELKNEQFLHPACNVKSDVLVAEDPGGTYRVIIQ